MLAQLSSLWRKETAPRQMLAHEEPEVSVPQSGKPSVTEDLSLVQPSEGTAAMELTSVLEFHRHVLAELTRRELGIAEKEANARRALEQILQQCLVEKGEIQENRELLTKAEALYRRFGNGSGSRSDAMPVDLDKIPPPSASTQKPLQQESRELEPLELQESWLTSHKTDAEIASTISNLRSELISTRG